ncbi:hypothetical protein [Thiobacter aerophilum]|uniref:Phosphoglycerate mutase n=1 Tax=Thiobacter aerophilum TaxID=3121275 RepID=A0ABV0EBZ6_9BURK
MQLTLVIPDLIPPRPQGALTDVYLDLHAPDLAFLLARGKRRSMPGTSLENWLGARFGLSWERNLPAAPLSLLAEHGDPGEAWWLCVDPVHLAAHQDQVLLTGPEALGISRAEAEQWLNALNRHFAGEGVSFHHIRPDRWYARFATPLVVENAALMEVAGRAINDHLPRGEQARRLMRLVNEIQMLLFSHPLNQTREAAGRPTVNSVWAWGGGRLPTVPIRPNGRLWADDLLAQGLARATHMPHSALPRDARSVIEVADSHLVVLDALRAPAAYGDADAWRRSLRRLEEKWFAPLAHAFRKGRLTSLCLLALDACHSMEFTLTGQARWKFWRRVRPLSHYAKAAPRIAAPDRR